jgi:carbamoyl-phosphate synthase small subunit
MQPTFAKPFSAALALADGHVFFGYGVGAEGSTSGEICFNTGMTGYQEILTDTSYSGQIVTFTFPHIGNVGCNGEDMESAHYAPSAKQSNTLPGACGLVLREAITDPSNWRSAEHLQCWLAARGITGISGIDTRALTRYIRDHGAQNVGIAFAQNASEETLTAQAKEALANAPDMNGLELAARYSTKEHGDWTEGLWRNHAASSPHNVVAIDYGAKHNILRHFVHEGCHVHVVPARSNASDILARKPDGIFLSNGPGDPAATGAYALDVIRELLESGVPIFGICLGHQLLAQALGATTEKMPQGHRGANHPVQELATGKVEITSQNHGFCVCEDGLPADVEVTHRSLFDGTIEGIASKKFDAFSVQYHPEASPGPHDTHYLFAQFMARIKAYAAKKKDAA